MTDNNRPERERVDWNKVRDGDTLAPDLMTDESRNWLIQQLVRWPERVDPDCTTNVSFLMCSAARLIEHLTALRPADGLVDIDAAVIAMLRKQGYWHYEAVLSDDGGSETTLRTREGYDALRSQGEAERATIVAFTRTRADEIVPDDDEDPLHTAAAYLHGLANDLERGEHLGGDNG